MRSCQHDAKRLACFYRHKELKLELLPASELDRQHVANVETHDVLHGGEHARTALGRVCDQNLVVELGRQQKHGGTSVAKLVRRLTIPKHDQKSVATAPRGRSIFDFRTVEV